MYQEHKYETTCAKFAPSGFYVASADKSARVLIWDCVGEDKVIKLDKQSIGTIADIAWSDDSKRVAVGGTGREKMGECFLFDSGASVGEITGHSGPVTSIDIRQTRPYRLATGSEDFKMNWFEGPPFKFKTSNTNHTRYINAVRFSPDGSKIITVGSDKKGFFYDGKEGTHIGELSGASPHGGSIYSVCWSPDSKRIITTSGDKTCKIWDADGNHLQTFNCFGNEVSSQQVTCLWQGEDIISVSLLGTITHLDFNNPEHPKHTQFGHNHLITSVAYDAAHNKLYTADMTALMIEWDPHTGHNRGITGEAHSSSVTQIKVIGDKLVSISVDDTIKFTPIASRTSPAGVGLKSQPNGVDGCGHYVVISGHDAIIVLEKENVVNHIPVKFEPTCIAITPDHTEVAVGSKIDQLIHVFTLDGGKLSEKYTIEGHRGQVSTLAYSPCGRYLASGDTNREVKVFQGQKSIVEGWVFHTSKIMSVAWSPDSTHIATGSVDSAVIVWSISEPNKRILFKLAHAGGVRGVTFTNNNTVVSVGEDCCMKSWSLTF